MDKTKRGYKLFEQDESGKLYPLFIDKKNAVEVGVWLKAQFIPTKGYASRGGWHIGDIPDAPWLKADNDTELGFYKSRLKKGKRVWCLVEYNASNNYDKELDKINKKAFDDKCPENGYYMFREANRGVWNISSDMKVIRIMSDDERQSILDSIDYDEVESFRPYRNRLKKQKATFRRNSIILNKKKPV